MKNQNIKILAIETSCDETAAAVIFAESKKPQISNLKSQTYSLKTEELKDGSTKEHFTNQVILSNVVSSQIDLHKMTGGVVPEVAARAHMEAIIPVIEEALIQSQTSNLKPLGKLGAGSQTYDSKLKNCSGCHCEESATRQSKLVYLRDWYIRSSNPNKLISYSLKPDLLSQITHIAVTNGPGLIGSLLVGFNTAKSMAYALDLPIIPVNHIEGHIYSALAQNRITNNPLGLARGRQGTITKQIRNSKLPHRKSPERRSEIRNNFVLRASCFKFPILALTVSGGHTSLTLMRDHGQYQTIGSTRDDAAGEAFDKVAKLLDLGYPGGPVVSKLAEQFRNKISNFQFPRLPKPGTGGQAISNKNPNSKFQKAKKLTPNSYNLIFPRPMIKNMSYDFSFSGLKTAVLEEITNHKSQITKKEYKMEICAAFEDAAVDVLVTKTLRAVKEFKPKTVILAGGVAANKRLREELASRLQNHKLKITNHKQISDSEKPNKLTPNSYDLIMPPAELCGDNAAMIGLAAYYHIAREDTKRWDEIDLDSNLKL